MSLQSIIVKLALLFAFIVFYLHYLRNINQYINITFQSLKSSRSRDERQQETQSHNQWLNSFQKYIDDLHRNQLINNHTYTSHSSDFATTAKAAKIADSVSPLSIKKSSSFIAEVSIPSNAQQTTTQTELSTKSIIPDPIVVPPPLKQKPKSSTSSHLLHLKESITEFAKSNEMINNDSTTGSSVNIATGLSRHPPESPRQGSDISSETKQFQLISCPDQSNCIVPALQLQIPPTKNNNINNSGNNNKQKLSIYLCKPPKHHGGVRFMYLVREGLMIHPSVHVLTDISTIHTADYIFFLPGSSPWHKTDCYEAHPSQSSINANNTDNAQRNSNNKDDHHTQNTVAISSFNIYAESRHKLIVLDEFDGPTPLYEPFQTRAEMKAHYSVGDGTDTNTSSVNNDNKSHITNKKKSNAIPMPPWYNMYFKRSFVKRHNGTFIGYPHLHDANVKDVYPLTYPLAEAYVRNTYNTVREIDLLCTLRGSKAMITRLRVQEWVTEYAQVRQLPNAITQSLNKATRTSINKAYFEHMHNAKIIVTVNPADWEGDFRLWESLASGALVFVDPLFVPHPYPLLDGVHLVYFSNHNKTELWTKLDYYLSHPLVMQQVACNGYLYAMKHHRAVNLIDYILCSAHLKQILSHQNQEEDPPNATQKTLPLPQYSYTAQYLNREAKRQEQDIKRKNVPGIFLENA